jgi:hypothetical protein
MNAIQEPARNTPVVAEVDLVIAGGSCTGVFAAVRAARLGLSVAIVERQTLFGGTASAAQVNEWHSVRDAKQERQIIGGLTMEVVERLRQRGALREISPVQRGQFRFNSAELAVELDALVTTHGIRPFLDARVVGVARQERRLEALIIEDASGRRAIRARAFFDASGDGAVVRPAGCAVWREPVLQPVNLQALVSGVEAWHAAHPGAAFWPTIAPQAQGLPPANASPWLFDVPGTSGLWNVFGPRQNVIDAADGDQLTQALMAGRRYQRAYVDAARLAFPDTPLHVVAFAQALGVRETWHLVSRHRLSGTALLRGTSVPDTIAVGTYPVDIHGPQGTVLRYLDGREEVVHPQGGTTWQRWRPLGSSDPAWYRIPYRSLLPPEVDNVVVAGRLIDADREAFGAVRVMVCCNQMGEAAGTAAALALRANLPLAEVPAYDLRAALNAGGSCLPE